MVGGVDLNTPGLTIAVAKAATAIAQQLAIAMAARRREPDGHGVAASPVPLALARGDISRQWRLRARVRRIDRDGGREEVALAGNQLDQLALIVAERGPEFPDALKQTVVADMDVRPDHIHDLLLGHHASGVAGQQVQEAERLRSEPDGVAVGTAQLGARQVQFKAGKTQHDPLGVPKPFDAEAISESGHI